MLLVLLIVTVYFSWPRDDAAVKKAGTALETTSTTSTSTPPPAAAVEQVKVIAILNLRSRPSLDEKTVIGTVNKGEVVKVLERQDKWLKIQLGNGRGGYIANDPKFIQKEDGT